MKSISARQANQGFSELLAAVEAGEEVVITKHGRPVAVLSPFQTAALTAERQAASIYVPAAVIWECGLLAWTGRVDLRRPLPQFFADLFSNPAYQPVDLTPEQIYQADAARPNRDPFDALICAAARHLELALLTRDDDIRRSGLVRVIW